MSVLDIFDWEKKSGEGMATSFIGGATTKKLVQTQQVHQLQYSPMSVRVYSPSPHEDYTFSPVVQLGSPYARAEPQVTSTSTPQIAVIPTLTPQQTAEQSQEATQKDIPLNTGGGMFMILLLGLGAVALYMLLK